MNVNNSIKKLEGICSTGVELRFKEIVIVEDHFKESIQLLNNSNQVILITGFCIKAANIGETDGPIGTVCMAKALEKLGKSVTIITD